MNKKLIVNCPNCGVDVVWSNEQTYRPFCSLRCKDSDFIDWATEKKQIPGAALYDDVFSESDQFDD